MAGLPPHFASISPPALSAPGGPYRSNLTYTPLTLRRRLAEKAGYKSVRSNDDLQWYTIVDPAGQLALMRGCDFELEYMAWDACSAPDYPADLNALVALADDMDITVAVARIFTGTKHTWSGKAIIRSRTVEFENTSPSLALALAIVSAVDGERAELEDDTDA